MRPPTALSIAGSDPSGADGIQADLKTFTALGVYGMSALTALTVQSTQGLSEVRAVDPSLVVSQIRAVAQDIVVDATRIGLLPSAAVAEAVADAVSAADLTLGTLVLDPVMVSGAGDAQTTAEAAAVIRERLLPLAHVATPNRAEAALLLGEEPAADLDGARDQAMRIQALGVPVVVLTGGHGTADEVVDVVVHPGGTDLLRAPRVEGRGTRGAGSTFSAAIAAQYARIADFDRAGELGEIGDSGPEDDDFTVIASAREFLASAVTNARDWSLSRTPETGHGPLNHLITLDEE